MHKLAPASLHVKRQLEPRELATIAVALEMLSDLGPSAVLEQLVAEHCGSDGLLGREQINALTHELLCARKVKVCRSKRRDA